MVAGAAADILWIGTFTATKGSGIYTTEFDPASGTLGTPELARQATDPSFLAVHPGKPYLYSIGRSLIYSFSYDSAGKLKPINELPATGKGPCHLAVSPAGDFLAVASFIQGKAVTYTLMPEGNVAGVKSVASPQGSGPIKGKQDEPHPLGVLFSGDFLFVPDMGTDRILAYKLNNGTLRPADVSEFVAQPGDGPRHLAAHPDGKHLFAVHMLSNTVEVLLQEGSKLTSQARLSTLPEDFKAENTACGIGVHPNGKWVLASNRGHDSIAVYRFTPEPANLELKEIVPVGVKSPRHFAFDASGKWLLVAGEKSNEIRVLSFDPASGDLKATEHKASVPAPACLLFQPAAPADG